MKIAIIGYSGCGKSTLAQRLGEAYGVAALHLDRVYWLPGWQTRAEPEAQVLVAQFMDNHASWVIEGNCVNLSYARRLAEADCIIFMNFNRVTCLWRVLKRYRRYRGSTRESMTPGCNEKLDAEFVKWILYDGRTKRYRARYQETIAQYGQKVVVLKNQRQLSAYMETVDCHTRGNGADARGENAALCTKNEKEMKKS